LQVVAVVVLELLVLLTVELQAVLVESVHLLQLAVALQLQQVNYQGEFIILLVGVVVVSIAARDQQVLVD
jgi:hypothetical protein